jgi:thiol-disulfide isomerase/thioredoxin
VKALAGVLLACLALSGTAPLQAQDAAPGAGAKAPAVTVNDLDGTPVNLGKFLGQKPVFLEFWATWCEVCEALLPKVKTAMNAYGGKVEFIGINVTVNQKREDVRAYLKQHQLHFRPLYDDQGASIRAYQVPATSYIVIADRSGTIVYTGMGSTQNFDRALQQVSRP